MKTTITLMVIGLLLLVFSTRSTISYSCFDCGHSISYSLASIIAAILSMIILNLVLVRLFKTLYLIQLNSYDVESLVPLDPWDFYIVPQHKPIYIVPPAYLSL